MKSYLRVLVGSILITTPVMDAFAWRVRFYNGVNCPDLNHKVGWHDYITNKVKPVGNGVGNPYGVEFRWAKSIADPEAIGNLKTNACYQGVYVMHKGASYPKLGYHSSRFYVNSKGETKTDGQNGLPGNPDNYEINIHGVELLYTDSGFVLDTRGRRVGILVCYGSNECAKY